MIDEVITDVLKAEGWDKYTDHPADRGGPTKWGITLKAWSDYIGSPASAFNIRGITEAEARLFYHRQYIIGPGYDRIASIFLMSMVVDAAVNHGPRAATKWLQRAVGVTQDGIFGPVSRDAVNCRDDIVTALRFLSYRIKFYGYLITRDTSQAVFAHGWSNRSARWLEMLAEHYIRG